MRERLIWADPANLSAPTVAELNAGIPLYGVDLANPEQVHAFRIPNADLLEGSITVEGRDVTEQREITDGRA